MRRYHRRWRRRHGPHRPPHGRHCPPHDRRRGHKLHRRLFFWFGLSILIIFVIMGGMMRYDGDGGSKRDRNAIRNMLAAQVTRVWNDKAELDAAIKDLSGLFGAPVVAVNDTGAMISGAGGSCDKPAHSVDIVRGETTVGQVRVCNVGLRTRRLFLFNLALGALVLWGLVGLIARRLVRPLSNVAEVARQIGEGELSSRVDVGHHPPGEIRDLADAINDMAGRIEKQMADQRELLAAVSHEIRTPLGHMRVIAELAREGDTRRLADLEREITDVDTLVDQLLASSRLEFGSFEPRELDAIDVCTRALERANIDAAVLDVEVDDTKMEGDPMLLSRAIGNLLENTQRHADRVTRLRLSQHGVMLRFCVEDDGPGFDESEIEKVFDSFYRGERPSKARHGSLGLGLALVRRIAEAHDGKAWAENSEHGARVSIDLPRKPRT